MGYEFDAFFSYKRRRLGDPWHKKVCELIEHWVGNELGREPRFFYDDRDVQTGDTWPETLKAALKQSKCLVCFWSPLYFRSRWCVSEWRSFEERSKAIGQPLILPASIHDGDSFPASAKNSKLRDFSHYSRAVESFWHTADAATFEEMHLKPFSIELARMIFAAPPHQDFALIEATEDDLIAEPIIHRIANAV